MAPEWFISCSNPDTLGVAGAWGITFFRRPLFLATQFHSLRQKHAQEHAGFHFSGLHFCEEKRFSLEQEHAGFHFLRVKLLSGAASESGPNCGSPDPAPKMLKRIVFTKGITIGPEGLQIW